jgi:hypothetical protein
VAREREELRQRELEQARALADAQGRLAQAQARTARRLRYGNIGLIVLLVAALLTIAYAFQQRNDAQSAKATALNEASARATAQVQAQQEAATARTAEAIAQTAVAETNRQRETLDVQRLAFAARSQFWTAAESGLLLAIEAATRERNQITEQTLRDSLESFPRTVLVAHHSDYDG